MGGGGRRKACDFRKNGGQQESRETAADRGSKVRENRRNPRCFAWQDAEARRNPRCASACNCVNIADEGYGINPYSHQGGLTMSRKRTPDEQPAEASTAVAEPPAAANDNAPAANDNQPSFAERVGQRKRVTAADPFGIAGDYLAGVRLFESKRDRQMAFKFDEKPSRAV